MGELHCSDAFPALIQPKNVIREEHDRLPLKQRLKILLARRSFSELFPDSETDETCKLSAVANDCFVKRRMVGVVQRVSHLVALLWKNRLGVGHINKIMLVNSGIAMTE
ncbi:hypothetical protein ACH5RR_012112 [Cinchona calisaya]|uniref:Uncharacterized protein n=1 Tax=Cinchona calisaya TaxID=153742 RepID=A0ABD3A9B0_9GENT